MNFLMPTHEEKQILPRNKLQRLAFMKGIHSAKQFANAIRDTKIASYGTAFYLWDGRMRSTQGKTLLEIAKFLGADSIDEVFDP